MTFCNGSGKEEQAAQLFEAMNGIRDDYLNGAILWRQRPVSRQKSGRGRNMMIAAAITVAVILTVFRVVIPIWNGLYRPPASDPTIALTACIRSAVAGDAFTVCTEADIDFCDGSTRIVVQDTQTGILYRSRALTDEEQHRIAEDLNTETTQRVSPDTEPDAYRIWILNGDGTVVSPCLSPSAGNIGVCELFDYESERVSTDTFRSVIQNLSQT